MKVFLGGTENDSKWRDEIVPLLEMDYFNPVVSEKTDESLQTEITERRESDFCLYVLTPKLTNANDINEVVNESFKKPDKTIFCFVKDDEGKKFTAAQLAELEKAKESITSNGGLFFPTVKEVAEYLNMYKLSQTTALLNQEEYNDVFISYGRRHSLAFARKLYYSLVARGYKVWFDMNDIPLAVDFQEQIDSGIKTANNFIFVISPHSIKSVYCRKEVELAAMWGKRIIPTLHVYPTDCDNLIHPELQKRNWLQMSQDEQTALDLSKQAFALREKIADLPMEKWNFQADYNKSFEGLCSIIESHKDYVQTHTTILKKARDWERHSKEEKYLIYSEERIKAQEWLGITDFTTTDGKPCSPPCLPITLQAEFIVESKKNATNNATDVFICYDLRNIEMQKRVVNALVLRGISTWVHSKDIQKGSDFELALREGIENSDNLLFLLSGDSLTSQYCQLELEHAQRLNKRILPILVENVKMDDYNTPSKEIVKSLQWIDFANIKERSVLTEVTNANVQDEVEARKSKSDFEKRMDELICQIKFDQNYFNTHKELLAKAIKWEKQNFNEHLLLRGTRLEQSQIWLKLGQNQDHKPLPIHEKFTNESIAKASELMTRAYLSFSVADIDFAHKLNDNLQENGHTTWLEDAVNEDDTALIEKEIEAAENVLFVLSPQSVQSPICKKEIEIARQHGKRIIGVLWNSIENVKPIVDISDITIIDFQLTKREFFASFSDLLRNLDLDREHVIEHTRWMQRANNWVKNSKDKDSLLRGYNFEVAFNWLTVAIEKNKSPKPTPLHIEYLELSKKNIEAMARREKMIAKFKKIALYTISCLFVVAVILGIVALLARNEAQRNFRTAKAMLLTFVANEFTSTDPTVSLRLVERTLLEADNEKVRKQFNDIYYNYNFHKTVAEWEFKSKTTTISYDEKYVLSGSFTGAVTMYSIEGKQLNSFFGHSSPISGLAFASDNSFFVSSAEIPQIIIWDFNGKQLKTIKPRFKIITMKLSPDNKTIVAGLIDNTIRFYDVQTGNETLVIETHTGQVRDLEFSADGSKLMSGSDDMTACLWDMTGKKLAEMKGSQDAVKAVAISPTGNLFATASADNLIRFWDNSGKMLNQSGIINDVSDIDFSTDGNSLVINSLNTIVLLNKAGVKLQSFLGHAALVSYVHFLKDGKTIISASENIAVLWKVTPFQVFTHPNAVQTVSISPDNKLIVTGNKDNKIRFWDQAGNLLREYNEHTGKIYSVVFSPDGKYLLSGSADNTARLFDLEGNTKCVLKDQTDIIYLVAISPNGKYLLTGSNDNSVFLYNFDGTMVKSIMLNSPVFSVAFSPNSQMILVACSDNISHLYDLKGNEVSTFYGHTDEVNSVAFSPDGTRVLTASVDRTARIWDLNGNLLHIMNGHTNAILSAQYSRDGKKIITASMDGSVRIWDTLGVELQQINNHQGSVNHAMFSNDGNYIVSASSDNTAKLFALKTPYSENTNLYNKLSVKQLFGTSIWDIDYPPKVYDNDTLLAMVQYYAGVIRITNDNQKKSNYYKMSLEMLAKLATQNLGLEYLKVALELHSVRNIVSKAVDENVGIWQKIRKQFVKYDLNQLVNNEFTKYYQMTDPRVLTETAMIYSDFATRTTYSESPYYYYKADSLLEKALTLDKNNSNLRTILSVNYGNLAYIQVQNKQFKNAIDLANKGLQYDSTQRWISVNLALAYLMDNQLDKSKEIIYKATGKTYLNKSFQQTYVDNITDLSNQGVKSASSEVVKNDIDEKFLKNKDANNVSKSSDKKKKKRRFWEILFGKKDKKK